MGQFFASLVDPGATQDLGAQGSPAQIRLVDSVGLDGAKLVEASDDAVLALRRLHPGVRVVPLRWYTPAIARRHVETRPAAAMAAPGSAVTLRVVSAHGGTPVMGAFVVAFVDFSTKSGDQGVTDANGEVKVALGGPHATLDRLYVCPIDAYWRLISPSFTATDGAPVEVLPLDLAFTDGLRHYYGNGPDGAASGVTVAVIDTGVLKAAVETARTGGSLCIIAAGNGNRAPVALSGFRSPGRRCLVSGPGWNLPHGIDRGPSLRCRRRRLHRLVLQRRTRARPDGPRRRHHLYGARRLRRDQRDVDGLPGRHWHGGESLGVVGGAAHET